MKMNIEIIESYLPALSEISQLQADVIGSLHVEHQSLSIAAHRFKISAERVRAEEAAGFRNLFFLFVNPIDLPAPSAIPTSKKKKKKDGAAADVLHTEQHR